MKFREKTYIITLVLFLLFFNVGIFSLAYYTYGNSMDAAEKLCKEECRVIADGFAKDSKYINFASTRNILMRNYCQRYAENNIFLRFVDTDDEDADVSNLPKDMVIPKTGSSSTQRIDKVRYFVTSEPIPDSDIFIVYAKNVSYLDEDFFKMSGIYVITSAGASVLLALCLFLVLRKLAHPLERLRVATGEIANGNFQSRADAGGKDEFSVLARDFNQMAEHIEIQMVQLKQSSETKQRMLDNLAHEMRTPLTSIRGYAEYLLNANISEEEKNEAIEFIISESERLNSISKKLLDETFIRENKIVIEKVNLCELISGCMKKMRLFSLQCGVRLEADVDDVFLDCDRGLIELLVTNLIHNAIKACRENGRVTVGCKKEQESVVIWVSDNGVGMTKEQTERITEPFYRTDKSRSREDGGIGLGLSLCERIATAHKARLEFESEIDKGTKAFVTFTNP